MDTITAEITLTGGGNSDPFNEGQTWRHNAWTVELEYQGRTMTVPFYTGDLAGEPTAADVLECIISDAIGAADRTFEEWALELGFDPDSRRAERTYRAVIEQTEQLRELLGGDYEAALETDPAQLAAA